jgi:hypothetical protein
MLVVAIQHLFPLTHSLESIQHAGLNQSLLSALKFQCAELVFLVFLLD